MEEVSCDFQCFIFSEDLKLPFLGSLSYSVFSCVRVFGGVCVYQSVMCGVREMKPGVMLSDYHMSECSHVCENLSVSM